MNTLNLFPACTYEAPKCQAVSLASEYSFCLSTLTVGTESFKEAEGDDVFEW